MRILPKHPAMKKLIVVTPPYFFPREGKILLRLFQEGMERLHLRKPGSEKAPFLSLLKEIPEVYHSRIVWHDHFEMLSKEEVFPHPAGIHLNRRNPAPPAGYRGDLSRSCHGLEEVKACLNAGRAESVGSLPASGGKSSFLYNYVFLSPLFPSISKEGYGSGFSLATLREAAAAGIIGARVVALGGLSAETLPLIKELPFGGAAVLGSLWGKQPGTESPDEIIKRYNQLQTCLI